MAAKKPAKKPLDKKSMKKTKGGVIAIRQGITDGTSNTLQNNAGKYASPQLGAAQMGDGSV